MQYCKECEKSFDSEAEFCPECGAELAPDGNSCADCADCAQCGEGCSHNEYNDSEHADCDGSCDVGLWPLDDDGKPVKPALLTTVIGTQMDYEITMGLLQSLGVPTIRDYPNGIQNAKILLGFTGAGMDIYVPENMVELAREFLNAEPEPMDEE